MGKLKDLMIDLHEAESKGYKVDWVNLKVKGLLTDAALEASEASPSAPAAAHEKSPSSERTGVAGHLANEERGSGSL